MNILVRDVLPASRLPRSDHRRSYAKVRHTKVAPSAALLGAPRMTTRKGLSSGDTSGSRLRWTFRVLGREPFPFIDEVGRVSRQD